MGKKWVLEKEFYPRTIWVFAPISTKINSTSLPFHLHNMIIVIRYLNKHRLLLHPLAISSKLSSTTHDVSK